jgi:2-polyprenyl-6-methoxyphenol hydroxylase-like FAD-dependent oxidoreductase
MKIAILGGGVAGVSSAIVLKQKGFDVSIYERHGSASNIGAGILVWPNAAYVLEPLAGVKGTPISQPKIYFPERARATNKSPLVPARPRRANAEHPARALFVRRTSPCYSAEQCSGVFPRTQPPRRSQVPYRSRA